MEKRPTMGCSGFSCSLDVAIAIYCCSGQLLFGQSTGQASAIAASQNGPAATLAPRAALLATPARPADLHERSLSGTYHFYLGTLHSHSGFSGDHAKTVANKFNGGVANYALHQPAEIFAKARTNFYDFYCVTDHSSPEQNPFYRDGFTQEHWDATTQQAAAASTPQFLAFRGYEFSRNNDPDQGGLGHMNVFGTTDWNSAYASGHTFAWLYDWMAAQTNTLVVAQFNHPQLPGRSKVKNFKNYAGRTKQRNAVVCLAEIWNSSESPRYVPVIQKIWALGWKVAPTAGTDVHGPAGVEKRMLRTGVLAEDLTTGSILRALRARRVYATLEPLLHVDFTVNGSEMGTALKGLPPGQLNARVFANDTAGSVLSRVEIFGGRYEAKGGGIESVATMPLGQGKKLAETTLPPGFDFYYAAVFKEGNDRPRAYTSPIWMDDE